jgi:hypothetical protein
MTERGVQTRRKMQTGMALSVWMGWMGKRRKDASGGSHDGDLYIGREGRSVTSLMSSEKERPRGSERGRHDAVLPMIHGRPCPSEMLFSTMVLPPDGYIRT